MSQTIRRAIILAAGRGSRLNKAAGDVPKCLARVGETTLLERQIGSLKSAGIRDILVITGYRAGMVHRACEDSAQCLENKRFYETNSLYSLWLARDHLRDGSVIMNGDVLFHPQLLIDLLRAPFPDALSYSSRDRSCPLGAEEMKVTLRNGRVTNITKLMDGRMADGENVGVLKFGRPGARLLVEKLDALINRGALHDWAPRAFRDFALERPLYAVPTRGLPWIEIDYPEDYWLAVNRILPRIEAGPLAAEEWFASAAVGE